MILGPASTWLMAMQTFLSEVVLFLRTWAVWHRNKTIGAGLALLMVAFLVSECVLLTRNMRMMEYSLPPYPVFTGCFLTKAPNDMWVSYIPAAIIQFTVFILMAISACMSYRGGLDGELSHIIHRDGVLFYIYLILFTVTSFIITTALPVNIMFLLTPLQNTFYAVLTSRMVLNIREVSRQGLQTELHTGVQESLVFARRPLSVHHSDELHEDGVTSFRSSTDSEGAGGSDMLAS